MTAARALNDHCGTGYAAAQSREGSANDEEDQVYENVDFWHQIHNSADSAYTSNQDSVPTCSNLSASSASSNVFSSGKMII